MICLVQHLPHFRATTALLEKRWDIKETRIQRYVLTSSTTPSCAMTSPVSSPTSVDMVSEKSPWGRHLALRQMQTRQESIAPKMPRLGWWKLQHLMGLYGPSTPTNVLEGNFMLPGLMLPITYDLCNYKKQLVEHHLNGTCSSIHMFLVLRLSTTHVYSLVSKSKTNHTTRKNLYTISQQLFSANRHSP